MIEAFIPAAGLGTRLKPLTDHKPKALVEVDGKTLLEIAIEKMKRLHAQRIVVNVHHFADLMTKYIQERDWGVEVLISDESQQLLDTGGGLKHAEPLFSGEHNILIHNVDVLDSIDYDCLFDFHNRNNALATLAVSNRRTSRLLLVDSEDRLKGWTNTHTGETLPAQTDPSRFQHLAFSGIALINPLLLKMLPKATSPYPIIPEYLRLSNRETITCFEHDANEWLDVGKPETITHASEMLRRTRQDI